MLKASRSDRHEGLGCVEGSGNAVAKHKLTECLITCSVRGLLKFLDYNLSLLDLSTLVCVYLLGAFQLMKLLYQANPATVETPLQKN